MSCAAFLAMPVLAGDEKLINPDDPGLGWRMYRTGGTCVLAGTSVSERRDDAFEVQFRRARGEPLKFFVLIPGLSSGGMVYIESPTTRDRWKISTDNYTPALEGTRAEAIQRNSISGIPIAFTFEYPRAKRVQFQTVPTRAVDSSVLFTQCVTHINRPLKPGELP